MDIGKIKNKINIKYFSIIGLFFGLTAIFLYPIFFGKIFFPGDLLYQLPPWSLKNASVLKEVLPINNPLLGDPVTAFYPWYTYINLAFKEGFLPLWNPFVMAGAPFLANWQSGALSLQNAVFYFMRTPLALNIHIFLKIFLTLNFTYLFLRKLKLSKEASVFGAITYSFSAFFIVWLNWPQTRVAVWLPLVLLSVEYFNEKPTFFRLSFVSLAIGATVLAGHPGTLVQVLFIVFIYSLFKVFENKKQFRKASLLLISILLGLSLAALLILPGFEMMKNSFQYGLRGATNFLKLSMSTGNLVMLFFPRFYGHLKDGIYLGPANFNEVSSYVGLLPLFFSFWALTFAKKNKRIWPFLTLGFISISLVYSLWPQALFYKIPLLSMQPTQRYIFVLTFCLSILGAFGFDAFFTENKRKSRFYILGTFFIFVLIIIFVKIPPAIWPLYNKYFFFMFIPFLALFGVYFKRGQGQYKWFLVSILVVDLFLFGISLNSYIKEKYVYPKTAVTDFISKDKSIKRTLPLVDTALPNSLTPYVIEDLRGRDALINKRFNKFAALLSDKESLFQLPNFILPYKIESRIIDFLNVKYLITETPVGNTMPKRQIKSNGFTEIYGGKNQAQTFVAKKDKLSGVGFLVGTFKRAYNPTIIKFKLFDENGKLLRSKVIKAAYFRDNSYYSVDFNPIQNSKGKKFKFALEAPGVPKKYRTALYISTFGQYKDGAHFVNSRKQKGDIVFYLQYHKDMPKYKQVFSYKNLRVYENKNVLPRAYAVNKPVIINNQKRALAYLKEGRIDFKKQVILNKKPEYSGKPSLFSKKEKVKITKYKANAIRIDANLPKKSIIVISDNFYPGWNAYVDGKKAPIYLANTSFRAIAVKGGNHHLEVLYQPKSFRDGLIISISSLFLILGFIIFGLITGRRSV